MCVYRYAEHSSTLVHHAMFHVRVHRSSLDVALAGSNELQCLEYIMPEWWSETKPRGVNDAPFFAMSEYDFRSKCVVVGCQKRGFRRELFVRDDCVSEWSERLCLFRTWCEQIEV